MGRIGLGSWLRGALFANADRVLLPIEAFRLDSGEIEMNDQSKDCEACYGTGNEPRMRAVQPGRKIPFHACPACGGTGKAPTNPPKSE
jgi:hypothetical protein